MSKRGWWSWPTFVIAFALSASSDALWSGHYAAVGLWTVIASAVYLWAEYWRAPEGNG